jgi:hypothetical protein
MWQNCRKFVRRHVHQPALEVEVQTYGSNSTDEVGESWIDACCGATFGHLGAFAGSISSGALIVFGKTFASGFNEQINGFG